MPVLFVDQLGSRLGPCLKDFEVQSRWHTLLSINSTVAPNMGAVVLDSGASSTFMDATSNFTVLSLHGVRLQEECSISANPENDTLTCDAAKDAEMPSTDEADVCLGYKSLYLINILSRTINHLQTCRCMA